MSDQPLESGQSFGEDAPTSETSNTGGQQTSTVDAEAIAKALMPVLEPWLERKLQSTKDRRFSQIERKLESTDGALARFAELVKGGMTPDQAQERLKFESAIEWVEQQRNQPARGSETSEPKPARGNAGGAQAIDEAAQFLKEAGLSEDPEWVKMASEGFTSSHEAVKAATNLIIRRMLKGRNANPAAVIQPSGGSLPPQNLEEEYRKELLAAKGKGNDAGREIRRKYRELGLNI